MTPSPTTATGPGVKAHTADPLSGVVALLKDKWPRDVKRPFIVLRAEAPQASVEEGDWVLVYAGSEAATHLKRGQGSVEDATYSFTLDVRSRSRQAAWTVKEALLHNILEPHRIRPIADWTEWSWVERSISHFASYSQVLLEVKLLAWKRRRSLPIALD